MQYRIVIDNGEEADEQVEVQCDPGKVYREQRKVASENPGRPVAIFRQVGSVIRCEEQKATRFVTVGE